MNYNDIKNTNDYNNVGGGIVVNNFHGFVWLRVYRMKGFVISGEINDKEGSTLYLIWMLRA